MKLILLLSTYLLIGPALVHDLHMSNCEIEYKADESTIQVSLRVFIDDLEAALVERGSENLYLFTKKEHPEAEAYIIDYVKDMFKMSADGAEVEYTFIGREMSDDLAAAWCYLEINDISISKELSVENQVLMDLFDDQRNLTKVKLAKNNKEHFLFDPSDFTGQIQVK